MPLNSFGAILNFAENVEKEDMAFYQTAATQAEATIHLKFASLAIEGKKHIAQIQRTRRENVTEMILEPIQDFERSSYQMHIGDPAEMDAETLMTTAISLEARAIRYYGDAARKMRALPEVARALQTLAKKRKGRRERLERA